MLRHLGLIAVCACIVASVGCDGGKLTAPTPPPAIAIESMVTVEFGGRVVNADAGGPVANVRVSVSAWSSRGGGIGSEMPRRTLQRPVEMAHLPSHSISRVIGRWSTLNSPVRLDTTIRAGDSSRRRSLSNPAVLGCRRSSGDQDVSDARDQARRID